MASLLRRSKECVITSQVLRAGKEGVFHSREEMLIALCLWLGKSADIYRDKVLELERLKLLEPKIFEILEKQ